MPKAHADITDDDGVFNGREIGGGVVRGGAKPLAAEELADAGQLCDFEMADFASIAFELARMFRLRLACFRVCALVD